MAGIVLATLAAVDWAFHGAIALAWTAFSFGVLGVFVLIACLWLYVRRGVGHAREERSRPEPGPAAWPRDRAQERAWLREPPMPSAGVSPTPRGAMASRRNPSESHRSKRTVAL